MGAQACQAFRSWNLLTERIGPDPDGPKPYFWRSPASPEGPEKRFPERNISCR